MSQLHLGSNGSAVQLRFVLPQDLNKIKELCREWFPIRYPDSWYDDICINQKFFSLAAVHCMEIIGLIVAEIKPQTKCNQEDKGLLASTFPGSTKVAYILTLGVVGKYRKRGVATLLLDNLIYFLTTNPSMSDCKAIYLHVLTSNDVAISFYERRQFRKHLYLPFYYSLHGKNCDGYSYVLYINGGYPPWTLLNTNYLQLFQPLHNFVSKVNPCRIMKKFVQVVSYFLSKVLPSSESPQFFPAARISSERPDGFYREVKKDEVFHYRELLDNEANIKFAEQSYHLYR